MPYRAPRTPPTHTHTHPSHTLSLPAPQAFGKVMERFFLPALVVLGLGIGSIAASSYNENADVFIKT